VTRNVTEIQQKLIALGYLAPVNAKGERNDDGRFGELSLDAFNHYRATLGLGPLVKTSMDELNRVLFPEEQPPPAPKRTNPITDFIRNAAISAALNQLKGLIPMNFLLGSGTAITGTIMIVVGAGSLIGSILPLGVIPGFSPLDPAAAWLSVTNGFGLVFLRRAIANK
jgi:hypothetical protein